jgi:hypothetical protein
MLTDELWRIVKVDAVTVKQAIAGDFARVDVFLRVLRFSSPQSQFETGRWTARTVIRIRSCVKRKFWGTHLQN